MAVDRITLACLGRGSLVRRSQEATTDSAAFYRCDCAYSVVIVCCFYVWEAVTIYMSPNNSLQATAAGPSVLWSGGDSLLLGFVEAQFPRLCLSSGR